MRDGKARIGADLTAPPLRFRDKDENPTGMGIEILMLMLDDIGVEAEFVDNAVRADICRFGIRQV